MDSSSLFSQYSSHFGYIGIFLFFLTVDQVTAFPEEVTLLTIGYLASNHVFNPLIAGIVSLLAFLTVDLVYFLLARSGNRFIARVTAKRSKLLTRYKEKLRTHFGTTILILCFIPRMRFFGPVFAGTMNSSIKDFLLFDAIGLSVFTCIYITLGVVFHASLHAQLEKFESYQHVIFASTMALLALVLIIFLRKRSYHEGN